MNKKSELITMNEFQSSFKSICSRPLNEDELAKWILIAKSASEKDLRPDETINEESNNNE